ncbi:MAG: metalloregulator ArsR/SmtB family transcription factor [Rhodobacteraceae bacterium]|jgi:protein-tyrosine-phosphatase|nr:metalloregulator ArsR/SmtB family transcription factor [Paracoccaceae bacterium]
MELNHASQGFAALGHPGRLAVFRLLMRFAPQGARPTEIAASLGLKQNTLSHHLADLTASGLVQVKRQGRSLHYSVNLDPTAGLIGYLALDVGRARPDLLTPVQAGQQDRGGRDTGFDVLFICSGNSARSILAEALLRDLGRGRFRAFSGGTRPNSALNPLALEVLQRNGHGLSGLRSKPLSDYRNPEAPAMDFIFTLCDAAASEDCPPWPGQPITGHWGLPDPAKATGTAAEKALAFAQAYGALRRRIAAFVDLPFEALDRLALQGGVDRIGLPSDPEVGG